MQCTTGCCLVATALVLSRWRTPSKRRSWRRRGSRVGTQATPSQQPACCGRWSIKMRVPYALFHLPRWIMHVPYRYVLLATLFLFGSLHFPFRHVLFAVLFSLSHVSLNIVVCLYLYINYASTGTHS